MRILVGCHCKSPVYDPKTGYQGSSKLLFKSNTIDPSTVELSYMDKDELCPDYGTPLQYSDWGEIPANYFDYVWLQNCPIFMDRVLAVDIIRTALQKVKVGGKVIVGTLEKGNIENYLLSISQEVGSMFEVKDKDELLFNLLTPFEGGGAFSASQKKRYYIFIKVNHDGGGLKKRNKRKYSRRNKKKNIKKTHKK
jgi:hypothetical protein